jgi:hypothetical protein
VAKVVEHLPSKCKIKLKPQYRKKKKKKVCFLFNKIMVFFLPNFYYQADKWQKTLQCTFGFFSFFTYIKYIGKSAVAFCYHDCYVGRKERQILS